jgi:cystathionine beta-synthase
MVVYDSVTEAIGGTPLFRLSRLGAGIAAPICGQAEFLNIGGSVQDRAALSMIEQAERDDKDRLRAWRLVGGLAREAA